MTALPLCGTQMSKQQQDGRLSNLLLSLGSLLHQMHLVTWEIILTIATYRVQGQRKFLANAAKIVSQQSFKYFITAGCMPA